MVFRVTAKVRISMAGTMAMKPWVRQFMASLKDTSLQMCIRDRIYGTENAVQGYAPTISG